MLNLRENIKLLYPIKGYINSSIVYLITIGKVREGKWNRISCIEINSSENVHLFFIYIEDELN